MAISIDPLTRVIFVPQADLTLLSGSVYQLDVNDFRLALKDLEDDPEGMVLVDTHRHNTEVQIGGLTIARTFEIINGYTVTFEDGAYAVNLVGANNNIIDVVNFNQVSVRSNNSAGLAVTSSTTVQEANSAAIASSVFDQIVETGYDLRDTLRLIASTLLGKVSGVTGGPATITFRDLNDTTNRVVSTVDGSGNRTSQTLDPS